MSLDIKKSAGSITAQVPNVSHQGWVVARQRKIRRARPPESSGMTVKTHVQSTDAVPLRRQAQAGEWWSAKREVVAVQAAQQRSRNWLRVGRQV
jgi:hypothetical protein